MQRRQAGLCPVSPPLYFGGGALTLCSQRIHMNDFMDYYADDALYHRTFESEAELTSAIRQVEFMFECLAQAGLDVNGAKTQVLLQIKGTHSKQALKKYTEFRKGNRFLRVSAFKHQRWFPI